MTTSQNANAALIRSLQRVRDRQGRASVAPASRQQAHAPDNNSNADTSSNNGERRGGSSRDQLNPKPQWNSGNVYQPTKAPNSVFRDPNAPVDNTVQRQVLPSRSPSRSPYSTDMTTPVKSVRLPSPTVEEPYRTAPVRIQEPSRTGPAYVQEPSRTGPTYVQQPYQREPVYAQEPSRTEPTYVQQPYQRGPVYLQEPTRTGPVYVQEPYRTGPTYVQQTYQTGPSYAQQPYQTSTKMIRSEPEVIVREYQPAKRSFFDRFRRNKNYQTNHYGEREILLNQPQSSVYRCCQCCAHGRLASSCPSCYFCELFYGCPLYCWLLTLLLLLLPMLALFGWLLSEQPAINSAKRRYVTQQSSIVQNDVYAVMHNCAVPYCTNPSPATTINQLYLTYHDYSATQITSNGNILQTFSFFCFLFAYLLNKLYEISN